MTQVKGPIGAPLHSTSNGTTNRTKPIDIPSSTRRSTNSTSGGSAHSQNFNSDDHFSPNSLSPSPIRRLSQTMQTMDKHRAENGIPTTTTDHHPGKEGPKGVNSSECRGDVGCQDQPFACSQWYVTPLYKIKSSTDTSG
jgi:hypothetical protein